MSCDVGHGNGMGLLFCRVCAVTALLEINLDASAIRLLVFTWDCHVQSTYP